MMTYFLVAFMGAILLQIGVYYLIQYRVSKGKIKKNIKPLFMAKKRKSFLGKLGDRFDRSERGKVISQKLLEMNLTLKPSEYMAFRVVFYMAAWLIVAKMLGVSSLIGLVLGIGLVEAGIWLFYRQRKAKYLLQVEEQLPEVCRMLGNTVRAGFSIQQGLQHVARVLDYPLGLHFRNLVNELALGVELSEGFKHLLERLPSRELRFFTSTILLQKESGGNLFQVMDQMADTLKQRILVQKSIETATAEGRFTAFLLPLLGLFIVFIFSQSMDLGRLLLNPIGLLLLGVFIVGQIIGFLLVRRISNIRV